MAKRTFEGLPIAIVFGALGFCFIIFWQMLLKAADPNIFDVEGTMAARTMFPTILVGVLAAIAFGYAADFARNRTHMQFTGATLGFNFGFIVGLVAQIVNSMEFEYFVAFGFWFLFIIIMVGLDLSERMSDNRTKKMVL
jgi:hypothetical protein